MGVLTKDLPKPLLDIGAESLIERHLRRLAETGVTEVVINLSYGGERIRERLGDGRRWNLSIEYSEEEEPLETGGGVIKALPLLGSEPFLLINADVLTDFDFSVLRVSHGCGVLLLAPNPSHLSQGDFGLDAESKLTQTPPRYTFAGISLLDPELFDGFEPGRRPLKPILDAAIERRVLHGRLYEGLWLDVGTPERLLEARTLLAAGQ